MKTRLINIDTCEPSSVFILTNFQMRRVIHVVYSKWIQIWFLILYLPVISCVAL